MANFDRPSGFLPYGQELRQSPYTAGGTIYPGDCVTYTANGNVTAAAAGNELIGVAVGYATSGQEVMVWDHPDQFFVGQASSTEIDNLNDNGTMFDILATTGDTTYKWSRQEVDSSSQGTGSAQLQLLGIERRVNNALGANSVVKVRINEHQYGDSNAGF
jgi:hypothetical protein